MKTIDLVVLVAALTLLSVLDASGKNKKYKVSDDSSNSKTIGTPVHILIAHANILADLNEQNGINPENFGIANKMAKKWNKKRSSAKSRATAGAYSDEESLKSLSDSETESVPKRNYKKRKPKRQVENIENFDEEAAAAADGLLSMSKSGISVAELEGEQPKEKKEAKHENVLLLKPITDSMIFKDTIKNYALYFDERNMTTVGSETLFKCISNSVAPKLAKFLIQNGARLADTEETGLLIIVAKEDHEGLVAKYLKDLFVVDPVGITKIFVRAADMVDENNFSVDMFFLHFLYEEINNFIESGSDLLLPVIEILSPSGRMQSTLEIVSGDHERVLKLFFKALKLGNSNFIEIALKSRWISVDERIPIDSNGRTQTLISILFGKLDSDKILTLIKEFKYDLRITHDSEINPNGDILFFALFARDLKSFKKLLLMGASMDVKLYLKDKLVSLEEFTRINRPEFYSAIQSFKSGTLKEEIMFGDKEENVQIDQMLVESQEQQPSNTSTAIEVIDLSLDSDEDN